MKTLKFDEMIRSLKQNMDTPHSFLLGAGASIESGIQSAWDCVWDWKREIFLSQNPTYVETFQNTKIDSVRIAIQKWLDSEGDFPREDSAEEYSFYAEKTYPIEDDRRKYFQHLAHDKKPSIGYHLICMLSKLEWVKSVWTTNFDGLMVKCAHQNGLTPIEITAETSERIFRQDVTGELLCVSLHGDYKYGKLKNTSKELDSQHEVFEKALAHELAKRSLIVIGYSGRDNSLMSALAKAYQLPGSGRLYWCGYGTVANDNVRSLIEVATINGRTAFYVSTDGFDNTLYSISRHCMSENTTFIQKIESLRTQMGNVASTTTAKFSKISGNPSKVVETNIYLISFPKTCYQFQINYPDNVKPWDYCRSLEENEVMAVPFKNLVYAWGNRDEIRKICGNCLASEIATIPFNRESLNTGALKELLLKTITAIVGKNAGLDYSRNKIWDKTKKIMKRVFGRQIEARSGVKLSLFSDEKYTYITLSPSFSYDSTIELTREERKAFADEFTLQINGKSPNFNTHNYIHGWAKSLFGLNGIKTNYPIQSNVAFTFTIRPMTALVGICNTSNASNQVPANIDRRRILIHALECFDPDLEFYDLQSQRHKYDFHPMRGLIQNAPVDSQLNQQVLRNTISLGVICPKKHQDNFSKFINGVHNNHPVKYNPDYVIPFPGFSQAFKTNLDVPNPNSNRWIDAASNVGQNIEESAVEYGNNITKKLDILCAVGADVIIIYIPKEHEPLTAFSSNGTKYDLHDFVKAYAAQKSIATQFIRERTIQSSMGCQIMWALSLAIYVKSCRIPWKISGVQKDTAFAGIGYSINSSSIGSSVVIGCSHIYSADGQGMKYKLSKINEVTFDSKKNPYLSEDEAFRLGTSIKELFYKSFTELPKRVVVHKRTPFRKDEKKGLVESLSSAGIRDIELLEITYEDSLKCFAYDTKMVKIDGFPVRRGLCFPLNENTMFLYTHGIARSIQNLNRKYIQGGKTIPLPLKIVKHYGKGMLQQIAIEILGLSKMNWNSFGLYSKLPCTIASSNEIARIGWLLSHYEGVLFDYRFFM